MRHKDKNLLYILSVVSRENKRHGTERQMINTGAEDDFLVKDFPLHRLSVRRNEGEKFAQHVKWVGHELQRIRISF